MANLFKKKYMNAPGISFSKALDEVGKNPFVDWLGIVIISSLVALGCIGISSYLYMQIVNGTIQVDPETTSAPSYKFDQKFLSETINRIEAKEALTNQAQRGYSGPRDPSF